MREHFDDIIKRKLEQLPSEGTPDWSALQNKLEGEAFDALLRDQLNSKVNQSGADKVLPAVVGWDALEHKLNLETEVEGDVFDRIVSQKLANVETSLQPEASWKVLSHRMDTLWPLRKVLVRYRVLEIAAAIALLLTFAPHLRDNPISTSGASATAGVTESLVQGVSSSSEVSGISEFLNPEEIEAKVYALDRSGVGSFNSATSADFQQSASPVVAISKRTEPIFSPFALVRRMFGWINSSNSASLTPSFSKATLQNQLANSTTKESSILRSNATVSSVPTSPKSDLELSAIQLTGLSPLALPQQAVPLVPVSSQKISKWELGSQAGFQAWNISTPVDAEFEQQAFSRWRGSASLGLSANYKLSDRTSLGFGISHSRLTYDPNLPTVFDAADVNAGFPFNRTESFDGITVNLAQVPVDFRVQLTKPGKRVSLLAFAGLAGNFSLSSDFDVERTIGAAPIEFSPPSELEEIIENENTFSDLKEFAPGILEANGRFSGNTFLTARLGLESTLKVNNRISAFSAVSYNHFLPTIGGIGPNNDQLSSVSFNLGARVSL